MKQDKFIILLTGFTFVIIGLLLISYQSPGNEMIGAVERNYPYHRAQQSHKSVIMKENGIQGNEELDQAPLSEADINERMEAFIDILLQEIDDNYKVKGVSTKADLIERFNTITTDEVAWPYVEFYYHETEDGLYIVPTELPPWFIPGEPYELTELENGNILVEQENEVDLYGKYRIVI